MDRADLVRLVERIKHCEGQTQEEADGLVNLFLENVPHPEADDLIFYRDLTAEEVVDQALAYKPIELPPASD